MRLHDRRAAVAFGIVYRVQIATAGLFQPVVVLGRIELLEMQNCTIKTALSAYAPYLQLIENCQRLPVPVLYITILKTCYITFRINI